MEWKGISQFTVIKAQANYYPPNSEPSLMLSAKCNNDYIIGFYCHLKFLISQGTVVTDTIFIVSHLISKF